MGIMSNPLISVIVPVYRVEEFIHECVDSIIAQSFSNLEIILVNDGSPDRSGEICDEYAQKDKRIKVIHKANGGLSDARNMGLSVATGEFISFVDSDDIINPDFIQILYTNIGDADLSFCLFKEFSDNEIITYNLVEIKSLDIISSQRMLSELFQYHYPASVIACSKLYKSSLWNNVRFPKAKVHEDEFVIHEILDQCDFISFVEAELYYYRKREESIMSSASKEKAMLNKLEAFSLRRKYFLEKKMTKAVYEINGEILYRCLMQAVKNDNPYWKEMSIRTILIKNSLPIHAKLLLLMKKVNYNFYTMLQKRRNDFG
ncbi:hypothetical protein CMU71_15445 [Elizabethkingia anophelis]|uniref:glycosyltransferase family 2 protein n=1 Tax=Elizabethkingia anophelis TaxID=1117645 RepID=UPI00099AE147|nr:glycosyltransferase [Elizabethkingia anophelis]MCT4287903.1 glycosyltransferase [Elizabethkingia anophelis]MDV3568287.1 hypothetical protein [Elizabethkingia anophelis]MDV3969855.1 hypothetical protein [Elizabethkingia anophelis]OPC31788.1 hypothetical protein BAX98_07035 [Elizabethkingia anophelis]OPC39759.1 hypothetical protein BAY02_08075 [Elizabethkingia anophelis]